MKSLQELKWGQSILVFLVVLFYVMRLEAQSANQYYNLPDCNIISSMTFDVEEILANEDRYGYYSMAIDSLKAMYCFAKSIDNKKLEAKSLILMAVQFPDWFLNDHSFYQVIGYLEESEKISYAKGYSHLLLWAKSLHGSLFTYNNMYNPAQRLTEEHLQISLQIQDTLSIAESYMMLGRVLREREFYEEADSILHLGLRYQENQYNPEVKAYNFLHLSNLKRKQSRYHEAFEYANEGMKYAAQAESERITLEAFLSQEIILNLSELGHNDKLLDYLPYMEANAGSSKNAEIQYLFCKAIILQGIGEEEDAIENYMTALVLAKEAKANIVALQLSSKLLNYLILNGEASERVAKVQKIASNAYHELTKKNILDNLAKINYYELKNERTVSQTLNLKVKNRENVLLLVSLLFLLLSILAILIYNINKKNKLLARQNKELANREISFRKLRNNLYANLSHEFRTPLTVLNTSLSEMASGKFKGSYKNYSSIMLRNVEQLTSLTGQMFDLAKLEENKLILELHPLDINTKIYELLQQLESYATSKNMDLIYWRPNIAPIILADAENFRKIFINLVSNAIKYTQNSGKIDVRLSFESNCWQFSVQDNGTGISEKHLPYIFERYYQVILDKDRPTTGGLGLALTKQLIDLWEGKITVESELNKGSIFEVRFPYKEVQNRSFAAYNLEEVYINRMSEDFDEEKVKKDEETLYNSPLLATQKINDYDKNKPSILLIEDNEDLNFMLYERFSSTYRVIRALNGKEGLEQIAIESPDLVLVDIMMPKMNGIEFIDRMKSDLENSHIPIVVMSALDSAVHDMKIWKQGVIDFVRKPFNFEVLQYKVGNILTIRNKFKQQLLDDDLSNLKLKLNQDNTLPLNSQDQQFLNNFVQIIENSIEEELSIEDISKQLYISRVTLYNKIKALTDVSPSVFIRKMRLMKAKELLAQNVGNVSEVGLMVGYSNRSLFSRLFKDEFGVSPKHFMNS